MSTTTIGLLHPGAMGARVGAAAATAGAKLVWASARRSAATHERAREAGLEDVDSLSDVVRRSDVVFVVCPPDAALDVAKSVAGQNFDGIYVDANAIAPATAMQVSDTVTSAGASFVGDLVIGHSDGLARSLAPANSDDAQYIDEMQRFAAIATDLGCPGHGYPSRGFPAELAELAATPREPWTLRNAPGRIRRLFAFARFLLRTRR